MPKKDFAAVWAPSAKGRLHVADVMERKDYMEVYEELKTMGVHPFYLISKYQLNDEEKAVVVSYDDADEFIESVHRNVW